MYILMYISVEYYIRPDKLQQVYFNILIPFSLLKLCCIPSICIYIYICTCESNMLYGYEHMYIIYMYVSLYVHIFYYVIYIKDWGGILPVKTLTGNDRGRTFSTI